MAMVSIIIAACGSRFSGTYGDVEGLTTYEFDRNGQARISVLGNLINAEYIIDGNKVLVTSPQGTVVLTRNGKSLYGPMGLELTLRDD